MKIFYYPLYGFICLLLITSCNENESEDEIVKLQVSLVDAPATYESVFIDVQDVKVNIGGDEENGWQSLNNVKPGIYDILKLTNGEEAFLGDLNLPEGTLSQIRLILGDNNSLVYDGKTVDLKIPSGSQSGLKIKINETLEMGGNYKLILDFDADKSIKEAGKSGKFILKPVIRGKLEKGSGSISGMVKFENMSLLSSGNKPSVIYAINLSDTVSTFPNENGDFLIQALEKGYYTVIVVPTTKMGNTTGSALMKKNIEVKVGETTELLPFMFK